MSMLFPSIVGLILDIVGAILLAKGVMLSDLQIVDMAAMKWDLNKEAAKEHIGNAFDAKFGLAYLIAGFVFQSDAAIGRKDTGAALIALVLGVVGFLAWILWKSRYIERRMKAIDSRYQQIIESHK